MRSLTVTRESRASHPAASIVASSAALALCSISSTRRLSRAESESPWCRATAAKRSFVSFVTQVLSCVQSLIVSDICTKEPPAGYPAFHSKFSETEQTFFLLIAATNQRYHDDGPPGTLPRSVRHQAPCRPART